MDLKQSHDAPAPGTGKFGGTRENVQALRNPACWSYSFQTLAGMQMQQLLVLLKEYAAILCPHPPLRTAYFAHTLHLQGQWQHPAGLPRGQKWEMWEAVPVLCWCPNSLFSWGAVWAHRLIVSLGFQDAFRRWSNLPLPSKCHCLENKDDASAIFCKGRDRDDTTASCHSGIPSSERTFCQ